MLFDTDATLFAAGRAIPPYLPLWRRTFAGLPPTRSVPVELWFDRGPRPPLVERLRLPLPAGNLDRQLAGLFVAVLINNALCSHGAASVAVAAPDRRLTRALGQVVRQRLDLDWPPLSGMSPRFLLQLNEQLFGTAFSLDDDPDHVAALRQEAARPADATVAQPAGPKRPGCALAVNIGQHLIRVGLVRLDAAGRCSVSGLTYQKTWPEGAGHGLADIWQRARAAAQPLVAATDSIEALGVSLAATVTDGLVRPVAHCGLFKTCSTADLAMAAALPAAFAQALVPGKPFSLINDGEAQALFAYHHGGPNGTAGRTPQDGLLSVRLGACPAVRRLDATGRPTPGIHEYGCLITRHTPGFDTGGLFGTVHPYLSHYGVAAVAQELGLLEKYRLDSEATIPFFHDALRANEVGCAQDARHLYGVLGAHLALLVSELARHAPLSTVRLLGSRTNRFDTDSFQAVAAGFARFDAAYGLGLTGMALELLEESSAIAGLVGAAHAVLAGRGAG